MHTLRRKLVSESLMRSNLRLHNSNIRLRSSCNRILGEIIGMRGRVWRSGDVLGGPNISESSSVAFNVVVGSVIFICSVCICSCSAFTFSYYWLGICFGRCWTANNRLFFFIFDWYQINNVHNVNFCQHKCQVCLEPTYVNFYTFTIYVIDGLLIHSATVVSKPFFVCLFL